MNVGHFYCHISGRPSGSEGIYKDSMPLVEQHIHLIVSSLVSDICNFDFFVMQWKSEIRLDDINSLYGYC